MAQFRTWIWEDISRTCHQLLLKIITRYIMVGFNNYLINLINFNTKCFRLQLGMTLISRVNLEDKVLVTSMLLCPL